MDTQTKHDKAVFLLGMVFVVELNRVFIEKHGLGLFKGNTVLPYDWRYPSLDPIQT